MGKRMSTWTFAFPDGKSATVAPEFGHEEDEMAYQAGTLFENPGRPTVTELGRFIDRMLTGRLTDGPAAQMRALRGLIGENGYHGCQSCTLAKTPSGRLS